jgi:hypothetical protein
MGQERPPCAECLAAVLALSAGYRWVLALAALCYLAATWAFWSFAAKRRASAPL